MLDCFTVDLSFYLRIDISCQNRLRNVDFVLMVYMYVIYIYILHVYAYAYLCPLVFIPVHINMYIYVIAPHIKRDNIGEEMTTQPIHIYVYINYIKNCVW